ncbi:TPA: LysR substrate-binding domain-containing protein [Serratia marcescens]
MNPPPLLNWRIITACCIRKTTACRHPGISREAVPSQPVERRTLTPRVAIGDAEGQLTAVLAGHGIAQLPTWLVKRQLEEGALAEVLPHLATDGLPINVVWLKSRRAQPKVSALLQALIAGLTPEGQA